jgi:hypothetical protein
VSVGKEAYVRQMAAQTADNEMLEIMRAKYQAQSQMRAVQAIQSVWVNGDMNMANMIANWGNSPYRYEIRHK